MVYVKKVFFRNIKEENYVIKILEYFFVEALKPTEAGGRGGTGESAAVQSPAHTRLLGPQTWQWAKCKPCVALKAQEWGGQRAPQTQ